MLLLVLLFGCCLHQIATAIPSFGADCLREHNKIRARHGAPPLKWDTTLAKHAQQWADHLKKTNARGGIHQRRIKEGENVAIEAKPSCARALSDWYDEYCDYEMDGYCTNPPRRAPGYWMLHFTQLVWKKTVSMGVGYSGKFLVVRYFPKGNSYRHYATNVQCASKKHTNEKCYYY